MSGNRYFGDDIESEMREAIDEGLKKENDKIKYTEVTLNQCKRICEYDQKCVSIDYYSSLLVCNIYYEKCNFYWENKKKSIFLNLCFCEIFENFKLFLYYYKYFFKN